MEWYARDYIKKEQEMLSLIIKMQIYNLGVRIMNFCGLILSLFRMKVNETRMKVKDWEILQRQGEKLAETLAKQIKEKKEKMSVYVR